MSPENKKVIVIGERVGVRGPLIADSLRAGGADVVMVMTQCFV